MEGTLLLPLPEGMLIDQIEGGDTALVVPVRSTRPTSCCPLCALSSSSIHSHYRRVLRDVPCGGSQIQLTLTVRKFFCRNPDCQRKIFTERLPTFVEPWARMTARLCSALQSVGLATSGNLGARLCARLSMPTSRQTILRRMMDLPDLPAGEVVELGIDDFAFRRGYRFGTVLVDLVSHRVVDLLPDRDQERAAAWMKKHPEIRVVSRDRGSESAAAVAKGAPQAVEVADRFPVIKNLSEAVGPLIARCQAEILASTPSEDSQPPDAEKPTLSLAEWRPKTPAHVERVQLARRAGRQARYQQVVALHKQGMTAKEIASRLSLSVRTVQRWLAAGSFQYASKRRKRQSSFDAFAPYVLKRWKEGERNGLALWREIKQQGSAGSNRSLYRSLQTLKQAEVKTVVEPERIQKFSAHSALWLFVREKDTLDPCEQDDLAAWLMASPTLTQAYKLIQDFLGMMHRREGHWLDSWLQQVQVSAIAELQSFATGIERDKAAVQAGLTLATNNGMVEGFVTKVKLIKRQGYGRASFPLLRQRVLYAL